MTPTDASSLPFDGIVTRAAPTAVLARLERTLLARVDVAWLAAFRVLFGVALAVSMQRFLAYRWVDTLLLAPRFRFHYLGFAWVEPLPAGQMHALFWALMGLALAVAAGVAFRVTAPLFALGLTYVQLVDVSTYLNHYYLAGLLAWLLAISPASRAFSVDAWLARRRGREVDETAARAWLVLFRAQIAIVYVFAGLAKLQSDWLLHGQPLGIWLGARTDLPVLGRLFVLPGVPLAMSWAGFLFDTTIVLWLSWRRTRPFAYAVVLTFHALTRLIFDIGMFPVIMSCAALMFFEPSWPRRLMARFTRRDESYREAGRRGDGGSGEVWRRFAFLLGAVYLGIQVLLPLRCHLEGGNVLWHEQGMRFSWRVMVRAKGGATTFLVRSKESGRELHVSPREFLAPHQENEMAGQPDLVLQLAHHVGRVYSARTGEPVSVHVDSKVSLNGRPAAPMIDPRIDLLTVQDGLGPLSWVLPSPSGPPPATRPVL